MKFNFIVEYLIILIKPIVFVHNVLLMEGKHNMWNPWYLIPKDNQGRWNANFAIMLSHITRIECSSIWAIDMMAMGELEL